MGEGSGTTRGLGAGSRATTGKDAVQGLPESDGGHSQGTDAHGTHALEEAGGLGRGHPRDEIVEASINREVGIAVGAVREVAAVEMRPSVKTEVVI